MNEQKTKLMTGLFVCAALFLLLAMLFFFGLSEIFTEKIHLVSAFSESVQGLSVGSAVKYRGVPIGSVSRISILGAQKLVQVDMTIDPKHFIGSEGHSSRSERFRQFRTFLQNEMNQGIRCRLEFAGITGMKFIDLDYFAEPGPVPAAPFRHCDGDTLVYVPAVSSSFKDIAVAMTGALERISKVNFSRISEEMERSLQAFSTLISDPAIKSSIDRINEVASNLETASGTLAQVMSRERFGKLVDSTEETLARVRQLSVSLQKSSEQMNLPESAAAFRNAADAVWEMRSEMANTLLIINTTLETIQRLSDRINHNPGFMFNGGRIAEESKMPRR